MRHVGTSGWMYDDWAGTVYERGLPRHAWLGAYAERFSTVEINSSFYRLPGRDRFEVWRSSVPDGFVFATKISRYLSHVKRLRNPEEPVARFLASAEGLHERFGPSLLQLPPSLRRDDELLDRLLRVWPAGRRLAIELRHDSWFADPVLRRLGDHDVALVLTDRRNRRPEPLVATAGWGYVRLHEGTARLPTAYGEHALEAWDRRLRQTFAPSAEVFVYLNNDRGGAAVRNAERFVALGRRSPSSSRA